MNAKTIATDVLATVVPGAVIFALLQAYATPTADIVKTVLGLSAATISVFLAATAFLYGQYSEMIARKHVEAALMSQKELLKVRAQMLAPVYFPRAYARTVFRASALSLTSFAVASADYFGSSTAGAFVAVAAFLLFFANILYLLFMTLGRLSERISSYEDFVTAPPSGQAGNAKEEGQAEKPDE